MPSPTIDAALRKSVPIDRVELIVGMEIHVELATRSKMFTTAPSPACREFEDAPPNTLTDPVVLALPGALPVMNRHAVELSMLVGMALGCDIPDVSKWDRKSYFYPDLPKAYQLSQYDEPLCVGGWLDVPAMDVEGFIDPNAEPTRIRITRAHLEEDAGKLMHEGPGGVSIDGSIVDLNRAGTPLLEIVTEPDIRDSATAVAFARTLRDICRWVGATLGVMQRGHMRFEPNINCILTLGGEHAGTKIRTPIVEVKNLNSFRSVGAAIEYELREQPARWRETGSEFGPGSKATRGWDDAREVTTPQREKEDAHDYRYFPDPDLPRVEVDDAWRESVRDRLPELPIQRMKGSIERFGLSPRDAQTLASERGLSDLFEETIALAGGTADAGKATANLLLQAGMRLANERSTDVDRLGVSPESLAKIISLRLEGAISSNGAEALFSALVDDPSAEPATLAESLGLVVVRDEGQLRSWCQEVIDSNDAICAQIRDGKQQAVGRLIGEVMKKSSGSADAPGVRAMLLELIGD